MGLATIFSDWGLMAQLLMGFIHEAHPMGIRNRLLFERPSHSKQNTPLGLVQPLSGILTDLFAKRFQ